MLRAKLWASSVLGVSHGVRIDDKIPEAERNEALLQEHGFTIRRAPLRGAS